MVIQKAEEEKLALKHFLKGLFIYLKMDGCTHLKTNTLG